MGKAYRETHPNEAYDLSDPAGIATELAEEAVQDAKGIATGAAASLERTAKAAYERPADFTEYALRSTRRFARERPLDTLVIAAGIAFLFGRVLIGRQSTAKSYSAMDK